MPKLSRATREALNTIHHDLKQIKLQENEVICRKDRFASTREHHTRSDIESALLEQPRATELYRTTLAAVIHRLETILQDAPPPVD